MFDSKDYRAPAGLRWAALIWVAVVIGFTGADLLIGTHPLMIANDAANFLLASLLALRCWGRLPVSGRTFQVLFALAWVCVLVMSFLVAGFWPTLGFILLGLVFGYGSEHIRNAVHTRVSRIRNRLRRQQAADLDALYELPAYEREEDSGR